MRFRHSSNGALAFCRGPALDSLPCSQYVSPPGHARAQRKVVESEKVEVVQTNGSLHTLSVYDSTRSKLLLDDLFLLGIVFHNILRSLRTWRKKFMWHIPWRHPEHCWMNLWNLYGYFQTNDTLYDLMLTYNAHTHTHTSWTRFLLSWIECSVLQRSTTPCACQVKCHLFRRVLSVAAAQGMFAVLWASLEN